MPTIAEQNLLLRARTELPDGLILATDEFREGWDFVRTYDACRLEKQIVLRGWNFIRIAEESLRSGVGETSQESIASALKLTLRRISTHFNAVEVEHIELTQYPWFFLARVKVIPFRIQQGAVLPISDKAEAVAVNHRQRRLPVHAEVLYPHFESVIPQLKEMLAVSRTAQAEPQ
jgi:hypothetical protein